MLTACHCALRPLTTESALTSWTLDPLAIVVVILATGWYVQAVRKVRRQGKTWPVQRSAAFGLGILTVLIVTVWWVGAYAHTLFWVYTVQIMVLLVVAPALMMFGRPATLAREARTGSAPEGLVDRISESRVLRAFSNPALAAILLPVVTGLVFFTAVLPVSLSNYGAYEGLHLLLLVIGLMMVFPLAEGVSGTSLTIAAGILFGFLELLADAVPGIAIRLRTSLLAPAHYLAVHRTWGPSHLNDQRLGGAIVWFLAETIDLPVLAILVVLWIRADEREARTVDRQLDQQEASQAAAPDEAAPLLQRPWWEKDATVFGDRRGLALRRPESDDDATGG